MELDEQRYGDWIQTYTGGVFWPLDPRPEEVRIEDIAGALAKTCRYNGHTLLFYSVAEHCVLLSRAVEPQYAAWALLHDAAEAYLSDVPSPVKRFLPGFREFEDRIMDAVTTRFQLPPHKPIAVRQADFAILNDEKNALMAREPHPWRRLPERALGVNILALPPTEAEVAFLDRAREVLGDLAFDT
jgi:uncharacterized protein